MTLKEALESGKPFKRVGELQYLHKSGYFVVWDDGSKYHLHVTNVLADDWEIEETKVSLTKNQIERAFEPCGYTTDNKYFQKALSSLGFDIEDSDET